MATSIIELIVAAVAVFARQDSSSQQEPVAGGQPKSELQELLNEYTEDYEGDFANLWPAVRRCCARHDAGEMSALIDVASAIANVAEKRWNSGKPDATGRAVVQCLHGCWLLNAKDACSTFEKMIGDWKSHPILAGAALQMLARNADPEKMIKYNELVNEMQEFYAASKTIISIVRYADDGASQYSIVCSTVEALSGVTGFDDRVQELLKISAAGHDWLDARTAALLPRNEDMPEDIGYRVFDVERDICEPVVYWARAELQKLGSEDSERLGRLLGTAELKAPFAGMSSEKMSIASKLFTDRAVKVVLSEWCPDARSAFDRTRASK